ncbi:glycosyltransferase family 39 protein [Nocardia bovistercoris]|uniref:Glycosyltransferase family 39 protein n=1 Tax=Nocardia bovistercoris TaxID=2785916 RepID=A0A931IAV1_9NOCA|nr:glycosyltransferase family 39 protein [Nocardia bovistercoris]MBH0778167.1 glycosyltransferase family 39 protein [Nocardia bovistercoris]
MTATLTPAAPRAVQKRPIGWEYPALAALLLGTAIAYLCNLSANGWANSFYSAAVQAGSRSWEAFFFGSSDAANSITVDKPPASLWLMELSVRMFGLNSWSILVPQVLLGVGAVALLWATVRKPFGPAAGLLAGLVLAVTPVATLMFRFNNPDALLVFLMVAAAWAMTNAIREGRTRWLVLTGVFIGFGFLTKQLQVLLVVPALALAYLVAGPPALGKRILQLFAAGAAMVVAAGWWLLAVELWPADSRPWIGGSHHNSILELTLGYNGLGRLNGNERGSVGPGGDLPAGGNGMWGSTGITRLFEPAQGGQIAWLIPAALVGLAAGILLRGKAARTDQRRAALILWGGWLVVTALVFSFMAGIFHQYYTVALAPAIAALVGASAVQMWRERHRPSVRCALALSVALTTATAWLLLSRSATFLPWLRWTVLILGILAALAILAPTPRGIAVVTALAAVLVGLAGPVAYSVQTLTSAHQGAIPSAGPNAGGMRGFGGGPGDGRRDDGTAMGQNRIPDGQDGGRRAAGTQPAPGGATGPANGGNLPDGGAPDGGMNADGPGAMGGLLGSSRPSDRVITLLKSDSETYTWAAATIGSNSAAGYQLATELPIMPVGGFNGSDPSPTLAQFQQYVAEGKIHYFITGGGNRSGESTSSAITTWVQENFTATEVDGVTLYDLTRQH